MMILTKACEKHFLLLALFCMRDILRTGWILPVQELLRAWTTVRPVDGNLQSPVKRLLRPWMDNQLPSFTSELGIHHLIILQSRDFNAFDLRMGLPAEVSKLYKAINHNGGVTYIH